MKYTQSMLNFQEGEGGGGENTARGCNSPLSSPPPLIALQHIVYTKHAHHDTIHPSCPTDLKVGVKLCCDFTHSCHSSLPAHHQCILLFYPSRSITPGVRQPDGLALDEFKEFKDMEQKVLVHSTSHSSVFHDPLHTICSSKPSLHV